LGGLGVYLFSFFPFILAITYHNIRIIIITTVIISLFKLLNSFLALFTFSKPGVYKKALLCFILLFPKSFLLAIVYWNYSWINCQVQVLRVKMAILFYYRITISIFVEKFIEIVGFLIHSLLTFLLSVLRAKQIWRGQTWNRL
jgi:hypothetical protein